MNVTFRVDASRRIGAGHLIRCLTLADAFRLRGAQCFFLCRQVPDALAAMVTSRGHHLERSGRGVNAHGSAGEAHDHDCLTITQAEDVRASVAALGGRLCDWLVVDHYQLDAAWEHELRSSAKQILVVDDLARQHECDVLLDQNLYLDAQSRYAGKVPDPCRMLLGPRYALLREEFRQARLQAKPRSGPVRRILVSFGGTDATNRTAVVIDALGQLDLHGIHVDVVLGGENPSRREIEADCHSRGFVLHVQTDSMAQLVAAADLGIAAGGSATWERCCLGLPSFVMAVAENQVRVVHDCALSGALYAPGETCVEPADIARHLRTLMENPLLRQSISRIGMGIADGRGTERVLRALGVAAVDIRPAVAGDARNLFEWRNHPSIREVSRSAAELNWPDHLAWVDSVLNDPARLLLIGEAQGAPVGVVRFDVSQDQAQVSIYAVPGQRPGTGADLLAAAERWLSQHRPGVRRLNAEVLAENAASHGLFGGAGYRRASASYTKRIK